MGPSSATIVGLERSLHLFMESLRKVELAMLSGIVEIVKSGCSDESVSGGAMLLLVPLAGRFSCPMPSFLSGYVADPVTPLLTMRFGF